MQSWIPRRPSAKLRQRLFPPVAAKPGHAAPLAALWLSAAAAACVFLMAGWLALPHHNRHGGLAVASASNLFGSLTLTGLTAELVSNEKLTSNLIASLSPVESSCQQNLWSAVTFKWTKPAAYPSISGSSGLGRTNL